MSMRERLPSLGHRKRSRRGTEDKLKSLEFGIDDCIRFPCLLQRCCEEQGYLFIPMIQVFQTREDGMFFPIQTSKPFNFEVLSNIILKLFLNKEMKLKMIQCIANQIINSRLFYCLNMTILFFSSTLTTLKLDYCNLKASNLTTLQDSLNSKKTITELSICGNPNREQNFFCLLHCGLKVLNLRFCQINVEGLKNLARAYLNTPPYISSLIHLDLSHNMVFDEGCTYIANILRCDRNLLSINLTDCKIGDEGLKTLLSSFVEFSLNLDELYFRRKIRMEYYKLTSNLKLPVFYSNTISEAEIKDKLATIEALLSKHPLIIEAYEENGEIICKGNYSLRHFNIAYNPLTEESLNLLVKTLMEQNLLHGNGKGLTRIVLDGTPSHLDECENVKNTIYDLLVTKRMRVSSSLSNSFTAQNRSSLRKIRKASNGSSTSRSVQSSNKDKESIITASQ
ncbi:uncharacterized protein LOC126736816 [Anthonomus grandis grandis]|uniref:uncharacterized protein LOC126736816 n=1 Tax=Anthonomus grandis grandis TaxID=2921223 RepID=UPI0021650212|nr:uncharacterized protein LOC126736816 [Anthonomus grandis grandis]